MYYNIVVSRARNEHPFIVNFIDHYLNIGFDLIYFLIEQDQNYNLNHPKISFIRHNFLGDDVNNQILKFIYEIKKKENVNIKWVLHVDIDEFLFLSNNMKIYDYIKKFESIYVGQFIFKWAMIENFRSIQSQNDFSQIIQESNIYSNDHYKSMFDFNYAIKIYNPHFVLSKKYSYLDNIRVNLPLTGYCSYNNNYSNAILLHFHTRFLEDAIIKSISTNIISRKVNLNLFNNWESITSLINSIKKLKLPFEHSKKEIINKENIKYVIFNTISKIDNNLLICLLQSICFTPLKF